MACQREPPLQYPRALYDWYNHRFIVAAVDEGSRYFIAVSQSDDPTASWYHYTLATGLSGTTNDFTRLGQDRQATYPIASGAAYPGAIYLASNITNTTTFAESEQWLILPKSAMYNGQGFSYWGFTGMTSWSVATDSSQPVNVWSPYDNPRAEFFITSQNYNSACAPCNGLTVWAVSNPFSWVSGGPYPELSSVTVATPGNYSTPPNAVQSGSTDTVYTGFTNITGEATYSTGYIFAALSSANGTGGVASYLYRLNATLNVNDSTNCPSSNICPRITGVLNLDQSIQNYGTTYSSFFPVQQPDLEGNVFTVYSYSSATEYPGAVYIAQRVTQGASFYDSGVYLTQGGAPFTTGYWGNYNAVAPAGVGYDAGSGGRVAHPGILFSGMYAVTGATWGTAIGYGLFTSPTQP